MKSIPAKILALGYLIGLPALANDVGLHNSSAQPTRAIELEDDCREVGNAEIYTDSAYNQFGIGLTVLSSLGYRIDNTTGNFVLPEQVRVGFKSYVISSPAHGSVFQTAEGKKHFYYSYRANGRYVGKDSFVIGVDTLTRSGKPIHFKMKFRLSVVKQITNENERSTCVGMKFNSTDATFSFSWDFPLPVGPRRLG